MSARSGETTIVTAIAVRKPSLNLSDIYLLP